MQMVRVGLLVPHTDTTLESDLKRTLPINISIHTERMWLEDVTIESEKVMIEEELPRAMRFLQAIKPDVIIFGCTSAGAIYGIAGDEKVKKQISNTLQCPVISAYSAVHDHLRNNKSNEIAVLTPYIKSVTNRVVEGLIDEGLSVISSFGMGLINDFDIGILTPEEIIQFLKIYEKDIQKADTLFLSCTNLRVLECKEQIENELNIPVITSNDAIIKELKEVY